VANAIRSKAVVVTDVMERSVKKQLSYANDISADYAVIVGEKEIKEGKIAVKDLKTQEQKVMTLEEFLELLG
jgi:histidyl-tRNA synthetase